MPHIGNDIVDLTAPVNAQKSKDLRFLKKILTASEIDELRAGSRPDEALWSFWACKEAAYKVLTKQTGHAAFLPRRWSVRFATSGTHDIGRRSMAEPQDERRFAIAGTVEMPQQGNIAFRLYSDVSHVHCLAADQPEILDRVVWRVEPLPRGEDPSVAVRCRLIRALSSVFGWEEPQMAIRRFPGSFGSLSPPSVFYRGVRTDIDVSLSHDEQFIAYAFLK